MAFVNDLDAFVCAATVVTLVVCCSITFLNLRDWQNHWPIEAGARIPIIMWLGVALIAGAFNAYSPDANASRKTVEGVARFVAEVQGRHRYNKYICATSCQLTGGYALDLRDDASDFVQIGSSYIFTYLEKPVGGAFSGISLRVIAISEPDSGRVLYAADLTNHPYRIILYLLNTFLLVISVFLGVFLNRSLRRQHGEESGGSEEEENEPSESGPISLGLESTDGD